jgi:hypothetical protein
MRSYTANGYDKGRLVSPLICVFAGMASALSIASPPAAVLMCSRTKMRTTDERLRTLRLPGIGGSEAVGPLDLADQLAC